MCMHCLTHHYIVKWLLTLSHRCTFMYRQICTLSNTHTHKTRETKTNENMKTKESKREKDTGLKIYSAFFENVHFYLIYAHILILIKSIIHSVFFFQHSSCVSFSHHLSLIEKKICVKINSCTCVYEFWCVSVCLCIAVLSVDGRQV